LPDIFVKVAAIVVLLGGLIFIHELGHFIVAKLMGVKVLRFSIGFGPRLFGLVRGETEYRVAALPLGGYVKMAGDEPGAEIAPEDRGRGFLEQAPWKRLVIALAGPAANLIFPGLVLLAFVVAENGRLVPAPVVGMVAPGSPAAEAGLRPGDRILTIAPPGRAAVPVRTHDDVRKLVSPHAGEPLTLTVERDGRELPPLRVVPASFEEQNPVETTRRGLIGVGFSYGAAVVAPPRPGAAGGVEAFDLVVAAGGKPVHNMAELDRELDTATCRSIDLTVLRERPLALPGAALADWREVVVPAVPTCDAAGARTLLPADDELSTFVSSVTPGSPAERAGLRRGDAILSVNGSPVRNYRDVNTLGRAFQAGKAVELGLLDGRTVALSPVEETYVDDLTRETRKRLVVGFHPGRRAPVDPAWLRVPQVRLQRGVSEVVALSVEQLTAVVRITVLGISRVATGEISFRTVGGPIMLFQIASDAAEEGLGSFFFQMALISVNLGLMNLLPIPVLDGGHIAQALVEAVTRRPLSTRAREIANVVGLVLLFTLMILVTKNDLVRAFAGWFG